jgi:hypothetical protein
MIESTEEQSEYDDSPWTRAELETVAWEAAERMRWEEMDE